MAYRHCSQPNDSDAQGIGLQPLLTTPREREYSKTTGFTQFEQQEAPFDEQETEFTRELDLDNLHANPVLNDQHEAQKSRWNWKDRHGHRNRSRTVKQKLWFCKTVGWSWEILGLLVSLSCMVAVTVILFKVQDLPLPLWTFSISPNTMVSVFTTLAKSAMLVAVAPAISQLKWTYFRDDTRPLYTIEAFDEACRGPWGSAKLLWALKARAGLASVGAVIVLIALAMDPFAQQILSFESRAMEVYSNESSTWMPVVDSFLPFWNGSRAYDDYTPTNMERVIFGGLLGLERDLQWGCPTGNCTWTNFSTLGICSQCKDVSDTKADRLLFARDDAAAWNLTWLNPDLGETCAVPQYTTPGNITLTLQNGSYTTVGLLADNGSSFQGLAVNYTLMQSRSKYSYELLPPLSSDEVQSVSLWDTSNESYPDYRNPSLGLFAVAQPIYIPESLAMEDVESTFNTTPTITECELRWCAKVYEKVEMINGVIIETLAQNLPLVAVNQSGCWTRGKLDHYPDLPACQKFAIAGDDELPYGVFETFTIGNESNGAFGFDQYNILDIMNFSVSLSDDIPNPISDPSRLLLNRNISEFMQSTVNSMNNYIRTGPGYVKQPGIPYRQETFIVIGWAWFALPVFLVFSSVLFLISVIYVTSRQRSFVWKSSNLPLVLYGLNDFSDKNQPGVQSLERIQELSKRLNVQLRESGDGEVKFISRSHA